MVGVPFYVTWFKGRNVDKIKRFAVFEEHNNMFLS